MIITKHARARLAERFKIKAEVDIHKMKRKFERDFVRCDVKEGKVHKTIIWREQYLEGVFQGNTLVTVINKGYTPLHAYCKDSPLFRQAKQRYRNKNRRNTRSYCR